MIIPVVHITRWYGMVQTKFQVADYGYNAVECLCHQGVRGS